MEYHGDGRVRKKENSSRAWDGRARSACGGVACGRRDRLGNCWAASDVVVAEAPPRPRLTL